MIDQGMVIWHLAGFGLVVLLGMLVAKVLLPQVQGGGRVVVFGLIVVGAWFAHANYYIQSGPFLRDRIMAPFLGKRPPAERLAYTFEAKMWKDPNVREQLKSVPVLQRSQKGIELANAGIFRLSEAEQTRWLLLSGKFFEGSQANDCAGLVKGAVTLDMIFRMMNRLSEAEIQEYYNLVTAAVAVGAKPDLPPAPPVGDTASAFQLIYNGLSLSEQTRFRTAAMSAQLSGGQDACWLGQTLFVRIAGLPTAMRTNLIQTLTSGQPPASSHPAPLQARQF